MQIITPAIKDKILNYLVTDCPLEQLVYSPTEEVLKEADTDHDTLYAVLSQFQRLGFLKEFAMQSTVTFILHAEAHDFALKGGFTVKEEVFEANIKKLMLEIDTLKKQVGPDHLDKVEKIASTASALFAGLSLIYK